MLYKSRFSLSSQKCSLYRPIYTTADLTEEFWSKPASHSQVICKHTGDSLHTYTGLFEMIVGVLTTCHLVLQMQPHVISFCGITSTIRFMFLLFPQVSRNWRYKSEPPLKPSPLTCYKQFGTNSIIVLMFVESQRVHIYRAPVRYVTKTGSVVLLNKKIHILLSEVYCVWQVVKTPTTILNNPVFFS